MAGALRNLRGGEQVTDTNGLMVRVERQKIPHCIVLVPDLALLTHAHNLGGEFVMNMARKEKCLFHIVDPMELARLVQAAHILSNGSKSTSVMVAFDNSLTTRIECAVKYETPHFTLLLG
jgi:hypothetical protein